MATSLITLVETCGRDLGLVIADLMPSGTPTTTVISLPGLADHIPDDKAAEDCFLYTKGQAAPEWRRVESYGYPSNNNVTISRALTAAPTVSQACDMFFILNPDEMKRCVNEALGELFREERVEVALDSAHTLYDITTAATWLTTKAQVMRVTFVYTDPTEANSVQEWAAPSFKWQESADTLKLVLNSLPSDCTNTKVAITARRYYAELSTDAGTTTCPLQLIRPAAKKSMLQEIWHKLDSTKAKQMFGMEMALTDKDLSAARMAWRQNIVIRDPGIEEVYTGPDVPVDQNDWPW